jgi:hypothetical protein
LRKAPATAPGPPRGGTSQRQLRTERLRADPRRGVRPVEHLIEQSARLGHALVQARLIDRLERGIHGLAGEPQGCVNGALLAVRYSSVDLRCGAEGCFRLLCALFDFRRVDNPLGWPQIDVRENLGSRAVGRDGHAGPRGQRSSKRRVEAALAHARRGRRT